MNTNSTSVPGDVHKTLTSLKYIKLYNTAMIEATRRQALKMLSGLLVSGGLRPSPSALELIAAPATPATTVYPARFLFDQMMEGYVSNGRFPFADVIGLHFADFVHSEAEAQTPMVAGGKIPGFYAAPQQMRDDTPSSPRWKLALSDKARNMGKLHAIFEQLAKHPSETANQALESCINREGFGGDEFVHDIRAQFNVWPSEGGEEKKEELRNLFAAERETFFACTRSKLPPAEATEVTNLYQKTLSETTQSFHAKHAFSMKLCKRDFIQSIRDGLKQGYISIDLSTKDNGVSIGIAFSDEHPMEGTGFMIGSGPHMRRSTYEELNRALTEMRNREMLTDATSIDRETEYTPKLFTRTLHMTIDSSDPLMIEMARDIAFDVAQQKLQQQLMHVIGRLGSVTLKNKAAFSRGEIAQGDARKPVTYHIAYQPPQGQTDILRLTHDITGLFGQCDAVAQAFAERNDVFQIQYTPGILSVTLDPVQLPELDKQLRSITTQGRQK